MKMEFSRYFSFALLALIILFIVTASGCSFYHKELRANNNIDNNDKYMLHVLELDDFGSWWDVKKAQNTLDSIDNLSSQKDTYVVIFIHGWHNNADMDNHNYNDFKAALGNIHDVLAKKYPNNGKGEFAGGPAFQIFGIYLAWRGRSLPGKLDMASMWWRKSAAERVGDGDAREFFAQLQKLYMNANPMKNVSFEKRGLIDKPYMGLVTIGHSFGGQVLLKAIAAPFEAELTRQTTKLTNTIKLEPNKSLILKHHNTPVNGFGDLNIFVNPAIEAYQFAKLDKLYRQLNYPSSQTPQLVVFSSDDDTARQSFFPIARAITRPFRPKFRNAYQGNMFGQALGEFEPQRTHQLIYNQASNTITPAIENSLQQMANFDFTGNLSISGWSLSWLPDVTPIPNSPVAVVYTHNDMIDGHSGIFRKDFISFLAEYIGYIQMKRIAHQPKSTSSFMVE